MEEEIFMTEEEYASQAGTGKLLNPRIDSTFKAMFTQNTSESKSALKSFLEAATERKIKSCEPATNEPPQGYMGQRGLNYDIACVFDDGLAADIEMQAYNQKYDYGKRAEYQVARLETTYLGKGDGWEKAPKVYQISVLNFNYEPEDSEDKNAGGMSAAPTVSRYAMRTKDGRKLSGNLNIIFIELPKAEGLEETVETNTALENWAVFLRDADSPEKKDIINRLTSKEEGIMQAQKSLSSISENRSVWVAQYRQEMFERDRISGLYAARQEGLEEGRKEGRKEGLESTARNLLAMGGLTHEQVAKATGLSLEEIQKL